MEDVQEGYDPIEVKEDLLCSICQEVPKDPRLCKNKDHIFCLAHISRHLENSQTCAYCRDPLTLETLRRPTGFLKNQLDDLKIKCLQIFRLEDFPKLVEQFEFAPVTCGNEGCEMVMNKRDKENHEKNLCQFRIPKANQDEWKVRQQFNRSILLKKMT